MSELHNIFTKSKTRKDQKQIAKPKIIIDHREKNSLVASELIHLGCKINFTHLKVGDYITNKVLIERKTISDFLNSMINKRLTKQLQNMTQSKNPLLIIEGIEEQDVYTLSHIHENAIRGFILSIILKFHIPVIFTKNYEDTAKFILVIAKKSQSNESGINDKPKARNQKEQLQYIIEGFPGIGPKTARKLLTEFKTINRIINAPKNKLNQLIGKKSEIFKITKQEYS
ncbi:MAG: ERCC4 domain-containing protein [Nanoarchaeota archaeon]|nr:ERCC4 domain-containing protein [Nanoarchaeota archaeon]